jgi:PKD repeat protein
MKTVISHFILLVFCLLLPNSTLLAQSISGSIASCEGKCLLYTASGGTAPYTWTVTGGSPASFVGASLNICWAAVGTGNIAISDALGSPATLSVSINPKPTPNIVPPLVPACPANNSGAVGTDNHSNNCQKACANSCATYYAPFTAGSNYVWTAGGNTSLSASGLGNSQVNVCWGNVGNGWLKVVETNAFGCVDSTKICINKIPTPTASFTPSPTISVCQGQSVSFNNTSTGAVAYQWTFGGGTPASSTQTHPTVVFNTPGTYTISLVAQNECLCSDTATATITVMSGNGPPIDCISALCAGSGNVPYSTTAGCGPYIWSISGGTIVSGAGTANITVNWGFTPPFTLSLQAGGCGYCPMPTTVSVPIIPLNMPIVGNTTACYGDIATYSLLGNTCGGSYHTWNIDPSLGYIISGQGSPTILVQWYNQTICTPQNTTVGVLYDNCYLACEHGTGSLNVNLAQQFIAEGPAEGCVNSASLFKAGCVVGFPSFSPTLCNWSIITPSNVTIPNVAINTPNLNYVWASGAGTYTVIATPVNPAVWCNASYSTTIDIAALPPAPTSIVGPLTICPNGIYTYQATASPFVGLFNWSATNGSIVPVNGNTVNVTWAALGPYSLSVTQQAINSPNCTSLPYTVSVNPYVAAPPTGLATVCLGQTTTYSVPAIPSSNYVWSILPAGAGAFLSATTGNSVTVQWNLAGAATISVAVCGQTSTKNITVNGTSSISIAPISYCAGGSGVLMAPASVCAPYVWKNAANVTISTGATATVTAPGYYSLSATNCITGCAAIGTVLVTQNPVPVAAITTPDPTAYCGTAGINTTLYAQNNAGYSFQWYQGITPVGVNAPTHNVTAAGTYSVVVTNSFGCTASSNVINITYTVTCPSGPCSPVGTVMGMAMPTAQCNVWNFNGTATSATITGWNYGDGFSGANPSAHTYTQAGYYTATINAVDINGCLISATRLVTVPVAPNFNYVAACNRLVTFNGGLSTFVSPYSITNYSWDFGDPASGGANVATGAAPVHTFVGAGTVFNVTLTVTSSSGCTASIVLPVNVYPQATAVIAPPASVCAGTGVSFNGSGSLGTLVGYAWDFGDPASGAANASTLVAPSHSYVAGGTYTVTLTVTDIYGCTASSSASVVVFSNTLGGTIAVTPAATVCLGTSVTLTAPNAGNSYVWSNGQTTQSITTNTSGTYSVTISNANGCQYITAQTVTVYPAPAAVIEGPTELCEGDAATLKVSPCNPSYTYNWSNAVSGCTNQVSYTWSPLPVGTHVFTVTVTDSSAPNCSVVLSHTLVVYPLPAAFSISSVPSGSLCEGTTVVFSAPTNPSVTYFWNTGQSGAVITVPNAAAGAYYAVAVDNVTGCERKSNIIDVHPLPDVCMAPQGCYTAVCCDTLCVPLDPNITAYQWYFNNIPIVGAINNTFVTCYDTLGTGVYQVLLTNVWGCSALSPPLNLTILPCDTSACAFVMQDTIRCQQTTVGVTYQYGFNLFNNSGFTVNSVQLVGITSTGVLPTVSPNPLSVAPILNNTSGAVQWFTFGGAGVAAGDTVCFQVNVAKLIGGVMDSCCTSPITHCVVIPSCCNCDLEGFQAQVNQGFTVVPTGTCGQYILTPQALGACDSVEWLISPPLYSVGNVPVVVTLPTGTHYICMLVKRYDANGNLCAIMEKCITIVVPPCCVCDTHFYNQVQLGFSMSTVGYSGTFVPLGVFNNNCDVVNWSYTNGFMSVIMGSSVGSNPFVYNFPTAGFYTVYMCVTRTQADGTTCQYCVCRKLWIPPIIISDDDVDVLSLSVSQIIIAPHWHGCNTGWQDVQIDLLSGTQHGTVSFDAATGGFTYNASDGFVGTDVFSYLLCVNNGQETAPCDTVLVQLAVDASNPVVVHLRGMLSGAYDVNLSAMRTVLVAEHILPIVQPYNCAPWFYTGTEHFADITAVPANVVDYVFVEARAATDPNVLIERKVAVVLNNGIVTDHLFVGSGASDAGVHFDNLSPTGMYYFVLRHRNHLAVITAAPQAVGLSSAMINLSNPANVLGGAAQLAQIGGMYGLKAGDMNGNGVITVSDYNAFVLDVSDIGVYSNGDCNLDGNVITNDFNLFAPNSSAIAPSLIRY